MHRTTNWKQIIITLIPHVESDYNRWFVFLFTLCWLPRPRDAPHEHIKCHRKSIVEKQLRFKSSDRLLHRVRFRCTFFFLSLVRLLRKWWAWTIFGFFQYTQRVRAMDRAHRWRCYTEHNWSIARYSNPWIGKSETANSCSVYHSVVANRLLVANRHTLAHLCARYDTFSIRK